MILWLHWWIWWCCEYNGDDDNIVNVLTRLWIWRALFRNTLSANPKIDVAMSMPSSKILFWKRAFHKYVHIYAYICMWKAHYQNTIFELDIGAASSFSEMALSTFCKRALFICSCCKCVDAIMNAGMILWMYSQCGECVNNGWNVLMLLWSLLSIAVMVLVMILMLVVMMTVIASVICW